MRSPASVLATALLVSSASAFAPLSAQVSAPARSSSTSSSTTSIAADVSAGEMAKSIGIPLLFGGGLIPAAIIANKSMVGTLMKKRPEKPDLSKINKETNLDPTFGQGMCWPGICMLCCIAWLLKCVCYFGTTNTCIC